MKTAILRPVLLLIGLNIIIKPLWIVGIDRQVQLLEGPEVYGRFFALFQLLGLYQNVFGTYAILEQSSR